MHWFWPKKWLGLQVGRFLHKLIGSPWCPSMPRPRRCACARSR
jgi:hypothetical protein